LKVERLFMEEYPKMEISDERHQIWMTLLDGIGNEVVEGAALHILSTRSDWPPDIALLRTTALALAAGELAAMTGAESWGNILRLIGGMNVMNVPLTTREAAAFKATGSLYDLKRSTNTAADRARYITAYDALATRAQQTRELLPSVASLNERYQETPVGELEPAPDAIALPAPDTDTEVNTDEDARLIAHYQKQIRANLGMDPFEGGE